MNPETALASILTSSPGTYALLIGSGVSRASGISTGWEIVQDLIGRIAATEGASPENPVEWSNSRGEGHAPAQIARLY